MKIQELKLASIRTFHQLKTPLLVGAILGFAIGLVIVINNTNKSLEEARQESTRHQHQMQIILLEIQKAMSEDKKNTKQINDHLDCILEYFSTERRSGLFIEYTNECRLRRSKTTASRPEPPNRVAITPAPVAPQPSPNPPRKADRSFLDCSTPELRKRLKKTLDKETYKRVCK